MEKKTSLYLSDKERAQLKRLAGETGKSQASIVREAIMEYAAKRPRSRALLSAGMGRSGRPKGTGVADDDLDAELRDILTKRFERERT